MKTTKRYGKKADAALSLWVKLARAYSVFAKASSKDIETYGLTPPQFAVIECLGHLGTMRLSDLSHKHLVSGGNMTVVVDNLEKQGLVERRHCEEDRRAIFVQLTAKGEDMFHDIFPKHAKWIASLTECLTERDHAELSKLLKKLGTSLQRQIG